MGLERGLQRVVMFLRSPLQSANCGNTVALQEMETHCQVAGQAASLIN